MSFSDRVPAYRQRIETLLERGLPPTQQAPTQLHEAMHYAVLGGGKRLRPLLTYATAEALGLPAGRVDAPACAVEYVHAYSLVHDDLPAMDDDAMRRGKPSCHRAFGEATAILAGDGLLPLAFQVLSADASLAITATTRLHMIELLAQASGSRGMAGGQAMDVAAVGSHMQLAALDNMHIHKTGALIRASVMLACDAADLPENEQRQALDHFVKCLGLAFQIHDDVLDETGDPGRMGKPRGADVAHAKPNYPAVIGINESTQRAVDLVGQATASLDDFGDSAEGLRWLARLTVERDW